MKTENIDKKRWSILLVSCLANIFMGTTYCWSIFQGALMDAAPVIFGMAVAGSTLALAFTINTGIGPVPMILGGWLSRTLGPGKIVTIGGALILAGMLMTGFASSVGMVWLGFGLLCGLGVGGAYGVTINNTVKFFPDKRGFAAGLSTFSFGLGSIIFPPVIQSMVNATGIQNTFKILGVIAGVVVMIAGFFITSCPEGWLPEGYKPPEKIAENKGVENMNWKQMLRDSRFWIAVIAFLLYASSGLFVVSQAKQMSIGIGGVQEGAALATLTVSLIGIANSGGRLFWGAVSDKIGRYNALLAMAVIVAAAGFILSGVNGSYGLFIICAMLIALCYGGSMGIYPAMTADNFGPKNNGVNYGLMFCGFAAGGYVGPMFFTSLRESSGSYQLPLTIVGVFGILAFVLIMILVQMRKKASAKNG